MSLKTKIADLIESYGPDRPIEEAADIHPTDRPEIIRVWRSEASKADINEAYLAGEDDTDMATLLSFCLDEVLTHQAQQAMLNCFWAGMSWEVDKAILDVLDELEAGAVARKERADEAAADMRDWYRERASA